MCLQITQKAKNIKEHEELLWSALYIVQISLSCAVFWPQFLYAMAISVTSCQCHTGRGVWETGLCESQTRHSL